MIFRVITMSGVRGRGRHFSYLLFLLLPYPPFCENLSRGEPPRWPSYLLYLEEKMAVMPALSEAPELAPLASCASSSLVSPVRRQLALLGWLFSPPANDHPREGGCFSSSAQGQTMELVLSTDMTKLHRDHTRLISPGKRKARGYQRTGHPPWYK